MDNKFDPTQKNRDLLKRLFGNMIPESSPIAPALEDFKTAGLPKPEFDVSPEVMDYAYNIFPSLNEIAPKQQIPFAPEEKKEEQPELPQQSPSNISRSPAQMQRPEPVEQEEQPEMQPMQSELQQAQQKDPFEMERKAQQDAINNRYNALMAAEFSKLGDLVAGVGIGGQVKSDRGGFEKLMESADQPVKTLVQRRELELNKEKNDPNSSLSKMVRKSLEELGMSMEGMDQVSYAQIEKLYPSLTQALYTKIAAEARREEAARDRASSAERRADANYARTATGIDRMMTRLDQSKEKIGYDQAKQAKALLDEAARSTDINVKVQNAAAFMNYAKTAQGDDSVVRSEDMKVLAGSLGFNSVTEMLNKIGSRAKGTPFTPGELQTMTKVIDTIRRVKKAKLRERLDPIIKRAQNNEYDLSESVSPDFIDEIYAEEPMSIEDKKRRLDELRAKKGM